MAANGSLFQDADRQAQYEAMLRVVEPGERLVYTELLARMKATSENTDAIFLTLEGLAFRSHRGFWRRSEIVSYREPYFDHDMEGSWVEGELWIVRAELGDGVAVIPEGGTRFTPRESLRDAPVMTPTPRRA